MICRPWRRDLLGERQGEELVQLVLVPVDVGQPPALIQGDLGRHAEPPLAHLKTFPIAVIDLV